MIREGPTICYWCGSSIPFTINDVYWYCWNCRRYTRNDQIETELKQHFCGQRNIISPEHKIVMSQCVSEDSYSCSVPLITLTQFEYQESILQGERKDSYHTKEWYYKVQESMVVSKTRTSVRKKVLVERIPLLAEPESDAYKTKFAKFEEKEAKKSARRLAKRMSKISRVR